MTGVCWMILQGGRLLGGGRWAWDARKPFAQGVNCVFPCSRLRNDLRTVLAVKGPLRRAYRRYHPLQRAAPECGRAVNQGVRRFLRVPGRFGKDTSWLTAHFASR
jgi:hypothetical protein